MIACKIRWVDSHGDVTPDDNPAVGYAYMEARDSYILVGEVLARPYHVDESEHFPICAEHLKLMPKEHWVFEPFN